MKPEQAAEAFPVGEYIQEELEARGWTTKDLAIKMGGSVRDIGINMLALDMLIAVKEARIDRDMAYLMAKAFDVSPDLFLNLDRYYHAWLAHRKTFTDPRPSPSPKS